MEAPTAETRMCTFRLDADGIVIATIKPGAKLELVDAMDAVATTGAIAGGGRRLVIVDMRGVVSESKEARSYFAGPELARFAAAVALVVESPVSRMIANFFLRIGTQHTPTRVFDDSIAARAWLQTQSQQSKASA